MGSFNETNTFTKGPPFVSMGTSKIQDADDLQRVANSILREAMTNERSKRWSKVVHDYKHLLRILNKKNIPADVIIPSWFSMLLYEVYYHLGIALQHIGEHKKAIHQYTKAIEAVFVPKNGCQAGCNSNSCLMTPLYARRAFAYSKAGDSMNALKDAEKAVVLDNKNPDVYCIRAMVRSTRNETTMALNDSKVSLKYNPNHLCALILKGRLEEPQIYDEWLDPGKKSENQDHKKACSINPDCHNFLSVQNFNHSDILSFYERFLYSLSVPHTVCEVTFQSKKSHVPHSRMSSAKSTDTRIPDLHHHHHHHHHSSAAAQSTRPFRCGTPGVGKNPKGTECAQRRKMYGQAVREHTARPKTADQYMAQLEKQRHSMVGTLKKSPSMDTFHPRVKAGRKSTTETSYGASRSHITAKRPVVFQETNVKDAPRMYYRPWLGDKLPVAEVERKQWITPPFK